MSLSEIYGHEENLSKAIASSESFEELLNTCGVVSTEKAIFETRVDRGHDDHEGRIDILQPTTGGIVIVEVQYGTSDGSHAKRLQNYATNFRKPAFIIWVAEKFRKEHTALFQQAKTPVLCAKVSQSEDGIKVKKASPINWTKQSQAKRVREAHKKCLELMGKLFARREIKRQYYNDEIEFLPMQSFMGGPFKKDNTWTRELSSYGAKFNPWDFEANVQRIIEHYLKGFPKKTHFYLLKHPSFVSTKEAWKDEMACYWMLANIGNDHPYLDMSCHLEVKSDCNYRDINHDSRGGPWSHGPWFFAHLKLFSDDPYRKLWQHEALAELIEIEQNQATQKAKEFQSWLMHGIFQLKKATKSGLSSECMQILRF